MSTLLRTEPGLVLARLVGLAVLVVVVVPAVWSRRKVGLAVLVVVVVPAVWSRRKQRREAALAVLKELSADTIRQPAGVALAGADADLTSDERTALELLALMERVEPIGQEQGQAPPAA